MHGKNKLLTNVDRKPMIRKVVETALNSKADEVIVVLGWQADRLREVLQDLPCRLTTNKNFERGQSSSVKAGLKEVSNATRAILILPGDIAKIDARSINLVINDYTREPKPIIIAAHDKKPGHPILISRELFGEVRQIKEQTFGLKSVVDNHKDKVRLLETGSHYVLLDVDTPEDLKLVES